MPNANSFRTQDDESRPEWFLPLRAWVCEACKLVQLGEGQPATFFFNDKYPYFSSWSHEWLDHARTYAARMIRVLVLNADTLVVEVGSNDGYLLRYFKAADVPALGVDPGQNLADAARDNHGLETVVDFFGEALARKLAVAGHGAKLMIANNVLAHVPDPNDFVRGFKILLQADGLATFEFPHLLNLVRHRQFDTIYHEHFTYLSLLAANAIFQRQGLRIVRVEKQQTHGGSLRLFVRHAEFACAVDQSVEATLEEERAGGLQDIETYRRFPHHIAALKRQLLTLLIELKEKKKRIVGYGAPAKGNTLLNYCGIDGDFLDFTVDRNTWKQGMLLPGTRIPVRPVEAIRDARPDYVLVLPWNLEHEVRSTMAFIAEWGGRFIIPVPTPRIAG